jgi:hypothetical protein
MSGGARGEMRRTSLAKVTYIFSSKRGLNAIETVFVNDVECGFVVPPFWWP